MRKGLILMGALLLFAATAYADRTVWYVHPDSTLNSIQAGLDSCADNDIVLVGPGSYYENIVWPNSQGIHLLSELGPDTTIIDGGSAGTVITCTTAVNTTTIIKGFTIRNGDHDFGSGVFCLGASPTISDNIVTNNGSHGFAAAIYSGGAPTIVRNTITDNRGDGVASYGGGLPIIDTNVIEFNTATGIYNESGVFSIRDNMITHNGMGVVFTAGGGFYQYFTNNTISFNTTNGIGFSPEPCPIECKDRRTWGGNVISHNGEWGIHGCVSWAKNDIITHNGVGGVLGAWGAYLDSCTVTHNNGPGVRIGYVFDSHIYHCNIYDNVRYGVLNTDTITLNAQNNWWGHPTGPYHPTANPGGLGDRVSDYVDFDPWLYSPWGVEEQPIVKPVEEHKALHATIFRGPLQLPKGKKCRVFDITGRVVEPDKVRPGIYFIEVDGKIAKKVVKVR